MKLRLLKNLLLVAAIGVFIVSCMDDDIDPYIPPTAAEELAMLNDYIDTLENRGLNVDTTGLGVYYVIDSVGVGEFPKDGDTCSVQYTGFFLTGDVFDSSGNNTFDVVLGENSVIEGWEDGLKVFRKNAEGYLIIPSEYAYGTNGYSSIPPNTTLVFKIKMQDLKIGL